MENTIQINSNWKNINCVSDTNKLYYVIGVPSYSFTFKDNYSIQESFLHSPSYLMVKYNGKMFRFERSELINGEYLRYYNRELNDTISNKNLYDGNINIID